MKTTLIACLMCLTIAVLPAALPATTSAPSRAATIVSWTDGDTARVSTGAGSVPVRLIGIDAPESRAGERAAKQAVSLGVDSAAIVKMGRFARDAALRLAPPGTAVRVELDVQSHDRYGRLLAYLWLQNGRMVNEELVRLGYAMVLTIPPNVRYVARFTAAQADARRNRRGLWGDASPSVAVLALVPQPTPGSPPTPDPLPTPAPPPTPALRPRPAATPTPRATHPGVAPPCWARNPAWSLLAFYLELIRQLATELPVPAPLVITVQALDEETARTGPNGPGRPGSAGLYRNITTTGEGGRVLSHQGTIMMAMRHTVHYDPARQCWLPEVIRYTVAHEIGHAVRFQLYPPDRWGTFVARTGLPAADADEVFANAYARAFVQPLPSRPVRPVRIPEWAVPVVRDFVLRFPRRTLL